MAQAYPFRFYGARPSHWFDDHLLYEVLFVKPPTAKQKATLASVLEKSSAGTAVELGETLWSGRWARFEIGEREGCVDGHFRDDAPDIFKALAAACPIEQIVFHGATEAGDAWTKWSVRQQRKPTVGPAWGDGRQGSGGVFSTAGKKGSAVAHDDAFDRARARVAADIERREQRREAKRTGKKAAAGKLALVKIKTYPMPPAETKPPATVKKVLGKGEIHGAGSYWVSVDGYTIRLAEKSKARVVMKCPIAPRCVAISPTGMLAVGDTVNLHLVDLSVKDSHPRHYRGLRASYPTVIGFVRDGRGLVVGMQECSDPTAILGFDKGEVRILGRFKTRIAKEPWYRVYESGGRIFTTADYEVVNFDAAWERGLATKSGDDELHLD